MVTVRVSPGLTSAVPVSVGVVFWVTSESAVGVVGGVVSMINSLLLDSLVVLPEASVTVTATSKVPSTRTVGMVKSQVPSPLSIRLPSPAV